MEDNVHDMGFLLESLIVLNSLTSTKFLLIIIISIEIQTRNSQFIYTQEFHIYRDNTRRMKFNFKMEPSFFYLTICAYNYTQKSRSALLYSLGLIHHSFGNPLLVSLSLPVGFHPIPLQNKAYLLIQLTPTNQQLIMF